MWCAPNESSAALRLEQMTPAPPFGTSHASSLGPCSRTPAKVILLKCPWAELLTTVLSETSDLAVSARTRILLERGEEGVLTF